MRLPRQNPPEGSIYAGPGIGAPPATVAAPPYITTPAPPPGSELRGTSLAVIVSVDNATTPKFATIAVANKFPFESGYAMKLGAGPFAVAGTAGFSFFYNNASGLGGSEVWVDLDNRKIISFTGDVSTSAPTPYYKALTDHLHSGNLNPDGYLNPNPVDLSAGESQNILPYNQNSTPVRAAIDQNGNLIATEFPGNLALITTGPFQGLYQQVATSMRDSRSFTIQPGQWLFQYWSSVATLAGPTTGLGAGPAFFSGSNYLSLDVFDGSGTLFYNLSSEATLDTNYATDINLHYYKMGLQYQGGTTWRVVGAIDGTQILDWDGSLVGFSASDVSCGWVEDSGNTCYHRAFEYGSNLTNAELPVMPTSVNQVLSASSVNVAVQFVYMPTIYLAGYSNGGGLPEFKINFTFNDQSTPPATAWGTHWAVLTRGAGSGLSTTDVTTYVATQASLTPGLVGLYATPGFKDGTSITLFSGSLSPAGFYDIAVAIYDANGNLSNVIPIQQNIQCGAGLGQGVQNPGGSQGNMLWNPIFANNLNGWAKFNTGGHISMAQSPNYGGCIHLTAAGAPSNESGSIGEIVGSTGYGSVNASTNYTLSGYVIVNSGKAFIGATTQSDVVTASSYVTPSSAPTFVSFQVTTGNDSNFTAQFGGVTDASGNLDVYWYDVQVDQGGVATTRRPGPPVWRPISAALSGLPSALDGSYLNPGQITARHFIGSSPSDNGTLIDINGRLLFSRQPLNITTVITQDKFGNPSLNVANLTGTLPYANFGLNFTSTITQTPNAIDGTYLATTGIYSRAIQASQVIGTQLSLIRYDTTLKNSLINAFTWTSNYNAVVLADGPTDFWKCADTTPVNGSGGMTAFKDAVSSSQNGVTVLNTVSTGVVSHTDTSLPDLNPVFHLDGSTSGGAHIYAPISGTYMYTAAQPVTLEAVIRVTDRTQHGNFCALESSDVSPAFAYPALAIDNKGVVYGQWWNGTAINSGSTIVPVQQWAHVALTVDEANTLVTLYVNGQKVSSTALTSELRSTGAVIWSTYCATITAFTPINSGTIAQKYSGGVRSLAAYNKVLTAAQIQSHALALKTFIYDTGSSSDSGTANPAMDTVNIGAADTYTFLFKHTKFLTGSPGLNNVYFTGSSVGSGANAQALANISGSSQPSITSTTTNNSGPTQITQTASAVSSSPSISRTANPPGFTNTPESAAASGSSTGSITTSTTYTQQSGVGNTASWAVGGFRSTQRTIGTDRVTTTNYYTRNDMTYSTIASVYTSVTPSGANPLTLTSAFNSFSIVGGTYINDPQNGDTDNTYSVGVDYNVSLYAPNSQLVAAWTVSSPGQVLSHAGGNANDSLGTYTWEAIPVPSGGTINNTYFNQTVSTAAPGDTYWTGGSSFRSNPGPLTLIAQTDTGAIAPTASGVQMSLTLTSVTGISGPATCSISLNNPAGQTMATWTNVIPSTVMTYFASGTAGGQWKWYVQAAMDFNSHTLGNYTITVNGTAHWYDSIANPPGYTYSTTNGSTTSIPTNAATLAPTTAAQEVSMVLTSESIPSDANGATAFDLVLIDPNNTQVGHWAGATNGTFTYFNAAAVAGTYTWKVFAYVSTDNQVNSASYTCTVTAEPYWYQNVTSQTTTYYNNNGATTNYVTSAAALVPTSTSQPIILNLNSATAPSDANGASTLQVQLKNPSGTLIDFQYSTDGGASWLNTSSQTHSSALAIMYRYYNAAAATGSYTWAVTGAIGTDNQVGTSTYADSWSGAYGWEIAGPSGGNCYVVASDQLTQRTTTSDADLAYLQRASDMVSVKVYNSAAQQLTSSIGFDVTGV